jgi:16S rRNA (uracil1498-N3)-methyltransferase
MSSSQFPVVARLYCETTLSPGASVTLSERAARHVLALRLRVGDAIALFTGDGTESSATLTEISKRRTVALVRETLAADRESPLRTTLVQGVCAADRMDLVLQKATELGVDAIQPLVTARSIVRLSEDRLERRGQHWQNVVLAACEQCGRNRIPRVAPSVTFANYLGAAPPPGVRILLSPLGTRRIRDLAVREPVTLLVGPEGGFSPEERGLALAAGFVEVRFGPRVLRTETAPLAALAAIQALFGDC